MTTVLRPERPFDRHEALLAQRTLFYRHAPSPRMDAPAALFLHGLGGSALNWTDFMGRMSGRLDCYALDLHGFGSSPPPRDGDMTPRGHARASADFILERDLGPVHLFGNSMGGAVSVAGGSFTATRTRFERNVATEEGGASTVQPVSSCASLSLCMSSAFRPVAGSPRCRSSAWSASVTASAPV